MTPNRFAPANRLLTAAEFHRLADVPPEVEWFANLSNPSTRRAYENAIRDFMRFTGIARPQEFRTVTRAHIIAWRDELKRRVSSRRARSAWRAPFAAWRQHLARTVVAIPMPKSVHILSLEATHLARLK